jgi:hypothetical protein
LRSPLGGGPLLRRQRGPGHSHGWMFSCQ